MVAPEGVVVVDASIAVKWLVQEEDADRARWLGRQWRNDSVRVAAPHFLLAEVSNAMRRRVVGGTLSIDFAGRLISRLIANGLELYHGPELYPRALELAQQLEQGAVYDSIYLALAEALDCELWTADHRFHQAAQPYHERVHWLGELPDPR